MKPSLLLGGAALVGNSLKAAAATRQSYGMYVWTNGFDTGVEGCDQTELEKWDTSSDCFTHTWNTAEKRDWLWDTCNVAGREVGSIFVSDIKAHLQSSYLMNDCSGSDVSTVKSMLKEGHSEVQDLMIYALFADSDEAVSEQNHIKYVVWYNDVCALDSSERFDGVAINNEAWTYNKCKDDPEWETTYLDNLKNIKTEAEKQTIGTLLTHFSVGWNWGQCNHADVEMTWNGVAQKPTRHMIDIFDSIDIQVAFITVDAIISRAGHADYAYAVEQGKPVFATSYCNEVPDACTTTHFPDQATCAYSWAADRKSEEYLFSVFDGYTSQIEVTPCIHYFRGVYSTGGHPDWPSHWSKAPTPAPTVASTPEPTDAVFDDCWVKKVVSSRDPTIAKAKVQCDIASDIMVIYGMGQSYSLTSKMISITANDKGKIRSSAKLKKLECGEQTYNAMLVDTVTGAQSEPFEFTSGPCSKRLLRGQ